VSSCVRRAGVVRLHAPHILSFERLAGLFSNNCASPAALLSEEGRVMVLRALLTRRRADLQVFHSSAGLAGFAATQPGTARITATRVLARISGGTGRPAHFTEPLRRKLRDLALLQRDYLAWLAQHNLQDADCLLDLAAEALRKSGGSVGSVGSVGSADQTDPTIRIRNPQSAIEIPPSAISISALWLDASGN